MPGRALILAGGGLRVAWQAGVVRALDEAGLRFDHVDGTSGGVMNAAMLLSGIGPEEMGERWSTLDPRSFASPLHLRRYLAGPTRLPAVGDADGVRTKVFPHLGIDLDRLHAATHPTGTFNVCDFSTKCVVTVSNAELDEDLLVAGMSLPVFLPAVEREGRTYTDAVWIKDANLLEAVRRGMDELWLVWCIGNTSRWGDGPFEQYVHSIEMSASGALFAELDVIRALAATGPSRPPVRLHVVKPRFPLPLDPDYLLGRIDGSTLVAMGYRDATRYLGSMAAGGVPFGPSVTRMEEPPLGARFVERATGRAADGTRLGLELGVEVHDTAAFLAEPGREGADVVGWLSRGGRRVPLAGGRLSVDAAGVGYEATAGRERVVAHRRPGPRAGLARLELRVGDDPPAELRTGPADVWRTLVSVEPTGAHGLVDRLRSAGRLLRAVLRLARERRCS
jgi:hypothetical protein